MDGIPLRSTRRLQNLRGQLPGWYRITNAAAGPTQISIYDEIGFFGVSAGDFLNDLRAITGDIQLNINSPGGDIFQSIAIYNTLKQHQGSVHVIIDGLAASAASFIAQAASPGLLEIAPHAQVMIHNGFTMAVGDAADLRKTADLLDQMTGEIAGIYADRTGKPAAHWLALMAEETWLTDEQAVAEGLADKILGEDSPSAAFDLSVFARYAGAGDPVIVNADGNHAPMSGEHSHAHPAYGSQGGDATHSHRHSHGSDSGDDASHSHSHAAAAADKAGTVVLNASNGYVKRGGKWVFDPDNDGDNDATAAGDTDHDYWSADGKQLKSIPPDPDGKQGKPLAPGQSDDKAGPFPVLNADVDNSPWDGGKAMANGAAADDPAAFYAGICAGRKAGDASKQSSWALPYKFHPGDAPNAAGVKNALARLPQTEGLTNEADAKATLQKAMKQVNPDWEPDGKLDTAVVASVFTLPRSEVDDSDWDVRAALAAAAESENPAGFYRGICAGRRSGDPATAAAWALPYRYSPGSPPNAAGVRAALAQLPSIGGLANKDEARDVLDKAMKAINPAYEPDTEIDPGLLAAAFAFGLEGASK